MNDIVFKRRTMFLVLVAMSMSVFFNIMGVPSYPKMDAL